MTDNLTVEGSGAGSTPKEPVSPTAIEGADALSKLLDAKLTEALKPLIGEIRGAQSKADKLDKAQREFLEEYERQKKDGKSLAEAEDAATKVINERSLAQKREAALDILLTREGLLSEHPVGNGASGAVDVAKVVGEVQVDPNNPDVIAITGRQWADPKDLKIALLQYKAGNPKPLNDSNVPPTAPPPPRDATGMKADFLKEVAEAMKNSDHRVRASMIRAVQGKYREQGFPVEAIDLTKEFKF